MADDIKALTKRIDALEKALKTAETKIKALADNMTDSKSIDKYLAAIQKEGEASKKQLEREQELQKRAHEAAQKEAEKEAQKQAEKVRKDMEKLQKEIVSQADLNQLKARLAVVEKLAQAALARP